MHQISNCKKEIMFGLFFFLVVGMLVFRCSYGLGYYFTDEFVQAASINRYLHGDVPILEDWHAPTMLSGFFLSSILRLFNLSNPNMIQSRYIYLAYQVIVSLTVYFLSEKKDIAHKIGVIMYLCSTPYNIMHITYNTLSIGMFLLFCVLFFSKYNSSKVILAGIFYAIATIAIPYNALLYFLYFLIVVLFSKRINVELISVRRLLSISCGILVVFIPFVIYMLFKGSVVQYAENIPFVLSDSEHSTNIIFKLIESQYRIIRVYWRVWVPIVLIDIIAIILKVYFKKNVQDMAFALSSLAVTYATFRFAFIYGSVAINLAIAPMFFYGVQIIILRSIFMREKSSNDYSKYWLLCAYIYITIEYISTNTEILTTSAMFIVGAIPAIALAYDWLSECESKTIYGTITYAGCVGVFIFSILYLRMTFAWGDENFYENKRKITKGPATGIYVSEQSYDSYNSAMKIIDRADISRKDKVLVLPMDTVFYYLIDSEVSSPYICRFEVNIEELDSYYLLHDYKVPDVVIVDLTKMEEYDADTDKCVAYFADKGYKSYYTDDEEVVLRLQ